MVSERFIGAYPLDGALQPGPAGRRASDWLAAWGGRSFGQGIYRLLARDQVAWANAQIETVFPEYAERASSFGCDWLGRLFATDTVRGVDGDPGVLMFDVGAGEVLQVPGLFSELHDLVMVDHAQDALAADFFAEWRVGGGSTPGTSECVGYRVPLFLNGDDEIVNLEVTELDVYWTLTGQLWSQVRHLAPGTPISGVNQES